MPQVERAAIGSDCPVIAPLLDARLWPAVAARAQALHLASPKPNRIVFVRLDVIDHGCGRDAATVEAHLAERFQPQLVGASLLPEAGAIPSMRLLGSHQSAACPLCLRAPAGQPSRIAG